MNQPLPLFYTANSVCSIHIEIKLLNTCVCSVDVTRKIVSDLVWYLCLLVNFLYTGQCHLANVGLVQKF